MSNDIIAVTDEAQAQKVVELMFQGKTKKDACLEAGIGTKAFDRFIASSPLFVRQLQEAIRSQFAGYIDQINDERRKNLEAILKFSESLRLQLDSEELEDSLAAFNALLKLEKQLAASMEHILPAVKEAPIGGPPKIDDNMAMALMAKFNGANLVTVTKQTTIEVTPHSEVIEVVPQTAPEP